jgi:hypothetical protein
MLLPCTVREPTLPDRRSAPTSQIRARLLNVQNYRADKCLGARDRERLRPSRTSESRKVKFIYKGKRGLFSLRFVETSHDRSKNLELLRIITKLRYPEHRGSRTSRLMYCSWDYLCYNMRTKFSEIRPVVRKAETQTAWCTPETTDVN